MAMTSNNLAQMFEQAMQFLQFGDLNRALLLSQEILRSAPENADALHLSGIVALEAGNFSLAEDLIGKAVKKASKIPFFHNTLGEVYRRQGKYAEARKSYQKAVQIKPDYVQAWGNLGLVHQELGNIKDAITCYERVLRFMPDSAEVWSNLGALYQGLGKKEKAADCYRHALQIKPDFLAAWINLGRSTQEESKLEEAADCYRHALAINEDQPDVYIWLSDVLAELGQYEAALESCEKSLKLKPDNAYAYYCRGTIKHKLGETQEACSDYSQALIHDPDFAQAYNNLGAILGELGQIETSSQYLRRAIQLKPDYAAALNKLGANLLKIGHVSESADNFRQAAAIKSLNKEAYNNAVVGFGVTLLWQGRVEEAIHSFEKIIATDPGFVFAGRCLLNVLLYSPEISSAELYEKHLEFGKRHKKEIGLPKFPLLSESDSRKLRIGYVSSDFHDHPVGRNMMPLILGHDDSQFEVYLYGNIKALDEMTDKMKNAADAWRSIADKSDEEAAEMIRADKIDILVLLAGRFDDNRPLIATYRAAPIQVSFHDPATSGLDTMDYLITDHVLSPRNSTEKFTERLIHLPTFYIHAPLADAPPVTGLPAKEKGYITFGSFNNPAKLNEQVVALWSRILHAIPQSRLQLKYKNLFCDEAIKQRYLGMFAQHGIGEDRLELPGADESAINHLIRYGNIDIALDPFPFTGSTTTFEALWMGVPVITLMGERMVGRWSGAMLKKLGLDELIAQSQDEYVEIAKKLAANLDDLVDLREGLRGRVANSPLCDEKARTRQIERSYRYMWRKWCAAQTAST